MVLWLAPSHQRGRRHTLTDHKEPCWHFVLGFFLIPNHLLNSVRTTATKFFVPTNTRPTCVVLALLPHFRRSQFVHARQFFFRGGVRFQPCCRFGTKRCFFFVVVKIHSLFP